MDQTEWKVLLTYYFLGLKPKMGLLVARFMLPLMLIPLGGILASSLYGIHGGTLYGQFVAGPAAILFIIFLFPNAKSVLLKQDSRVARSIGQTTLLAIFDKIDRLQLPDIENAKRRHGLLARFWPVPNITERIKNLSD